MARDDFAPLVARALYFSSSCVQSRSHLDTPPSRSTLVEQGRADDDIGLADNEPPVNQDEVRCFDMLSGFVDSELTLSLAFCFLAGYLPSAACSPSQYLAPDAHMPGALRLLPSAHPRARLTHLSPRYADVRRLVPRGANDHRMLTLMYVTAKPDIAVCPSDCDFAVLFCISVCKDCIMGHFKSYVSHNRLRRRFYLCISSVDAPPPPPPTSPPSSCLAA